MALPTYPPDASDIICKQFDARNTVSREEKHPCRGFIPRRIDTSYALPLPMDVCYVCGDEKKYNEESAGQSR
jgi:hypothetical protein